MGTIVQTRSMSCWRSGCRRCCWGSSPRPRPCSPAGSARRSCSRITTCIKLFRKGSVFSTTTTWVFRAGPVVGLVTAALAALLIPLAGLDGADLVRGRHDSPGVPARAGPVLHGLGRAGHRLGVRGDGRGPRGDLRLPGGAGLVPGPARPGQALRVAPAGGHARRLDRRRTG